MAAVLVTLVKIILGHGGLFVSTIAYLFIGYSTAYGIGFLQGAW